MRTRAVACFLTACLAFVGAVSSGSTAAGAQQDTQASSTGSANAQWIAYAYDDLLGREADAAGVDFWLGRLAAGGDKARLQVARQFVFSPEGSAGEVERGFATVLGRQPDAAGAAFWTAFLMDNPVVTLRAALYSSDEVFTNAGGVDPWIQLVYADLLDRPPEPDGAAFWKQQVEAGVNRYVLVDFVYTSDEALGRRVDSYYAEVLGRAPTADEQAEGIAIIRASDERELRVRLIASDEKFEQFVPELTIGGSG